ncbi:hypothetical protein B0H10DRAFT_1078747 [Mycena sp. CBHHK59/15]|nr:hypothetical protein B0H10DRAFT_1078747 [Mycena sp. CBHHK59/15]
MRSTCSAWRKISDDTVIISASSCGRVKTMKTMPLPKMGKETSETPPAAPTLPHMQMTLLGNPRRRRCLLHMQT